MTHAQIRRLAALALLVSPKIIPPTIGAHPEGGAYTANTEITLAVIATGTKLHYQWYRNGVVVLDATTATLELTVTEATAGSYRVRVYNGRGDVTSEAAVVSVA